MATASTSLPLPLKQDREEANKYGFLGLLPGIALLAVVGYAGKFIEQSISHYGKAHHKVLPNIEYVLWAILIGILIANTVGLPRIFRAGVATYEFWLKAGIILLGARFILGDILHLSGISFVLIFIELALALTFMTYLGRGFNLPPKLISLLAVGSSVCGVSAIIATQGAIEADEEDSSVAIVGSRVWVVDRACGRQYGGGDRRGCAVLRRRGQVCGAGEDVPQRVHRLCGAGICAVLGTQRAGCGDRE
jgi:hypothetical protein